MDIDKSFEKKRGIVERELGDKLFFLLWFITIGQLGLIIWECLNLMPLILPPLNSLLGLSGKIEIKAIELTTTIYLIIQLAYMGKKEITRWVGKSGTVLTTDEYIRRLRRGDVAVLIWGILYITSGLLVAVHVMEHMPSELSRTFIQVAALYTGAFISKSAFKGRQKQTMSGDHPIRALSEQTAQANADEGDISFKERELLEFIKGKEFVTVLECVGHISGSRSTINRSLRKLVVAGNIVRTGGGKSAVYSLNRPG